MLELKGIGKKYKRKNKKEVEVLKDITINFAKRGMVFILGRSGSGKTTLLNLIGGLDKSDVGEIIIEGKSTKKFKERDYDNYRNKYIGFIFQDYNIIDQYTVIDNIKLSLNLQNRKIDDLKIENLLNVLGIDELKKRKTNELSGGEQQRIAIARAIIKNPKIVLADEPTGNLDSKNGIKVMNLLKQISKTKLVIVVTHDEEFAKEYGDRIIEINDGRIIRDDNLIKNNNEKTIKTDDKFKKPKLPIKEAIKLAFISLKNNKLKLLLTVLLITFSTIFLAVAYMMKTYDINENHFKILKSENIETIELKKYFYNKDIPSAKKQMKYLKDKDITNINNISDLKTYPVYVLEHNSRLQSFLKLNVYVQDDIINGRDEEEKDLYTIFPTPLQIVEIADIKELIKEEIIGREAIKNDEVVISNYLADLIIKYGIYEYESNEIYNPIDYNEIVKAKKKIHFGINNYVKIVGIINYDLSKYDKLKEKYYSKEKNNSSLINLNLDLSRSSFNIYNRVFVKDNFISNLKTNEIIELDSENKYITYLEDRQLDNIVRYINEEVEYYDGINWIKTTSLEKDEMILNLSNLIDDYYGYIDELNEYIKKYPKRDKLEIEKEFIKSYINLNQYIDKEVRLDVYEDVSPIFIINGKKATRELKGIKVIGITGLVNMETSGNIYSKEILEEYKNSDIKINGLILGITDDIKLREIIKRFPYNGKYSMYSIYSNDIETYTGVMDSYKSFIDIIGIGLLVFSVLLIYNFILNSILDSKKEIGIIKSLGGRKIDILKIFIIEGIQLGLITITLSLISINYVFSLINNTILNVSKLKIDAFYINSELVLVMFIYILSVILISSIIPLLKITKMKPIDVIYNKN